jgi:hypothetical protein
MHKVINYGSALQAWATQEVIRRLGYEVQIIDYIYPNAFHIKGKKKNFVKNALRWCCHLLQGFPWKRKRKYFEKFWNVNFNLTQTYSCAESIYNNPPDFDIYVAGSDQIWNPAYIKGDGVFLLDFVTNSKRRISYSSSFAQAKLEEGIKKKMTDSLRKFSSITVRESNGVKIVKELIGKDVPVTLDPTLLLCKEDYLPLIRQSTLHIQKPYMLVYILQYAYNPYPYATEFIREAHRQTGLHIVCLDFSVKQHLGIKDMIHLHDAVGPAEFLSLFANASLVITTSFHGTAFALNFGIPFYSLLNDKSSSDDRMVNLLRLCGMEDRGIILHTKNVQVSTLIDINKCETRLRQKSGESISYLRRNLM